MQYFNDLFTRKSFLLRLNAHNLTLDFEQDELYVQMITFSLIAMLHDGFVTYLSVRP